MLTKYQIWKATFENEKVELGRSHEQEMALVLKKHGEEMLEMQEKIKKEIAKVAIIGIVILRYSYSFLSFDVI